MQVGLFGSLCVMGHLSDFHANIVFLYAATW